MGCSAGAKDTLKDFGSELKEKQIQEKNELLKTYQLRMENSNLTGINLILITTYYLKRASHDKVREKKDVYVWLLKDSTDYDFSKEPYKTMKNLFKSELKNVYSNHFKYPEKVLPLHIYEDNEVSFKLFSLEESDEINEYELSETGVNCLVLFNLIDLDAIPLIKEINEYSKKIPEEVFKAAFFVNTTVKDFESVSKVKETLNLLGLSKIDFKFLRKNQSYFERKIIDSTKETTVLLYDHQGVLRFYDKIRKFSLNEIEFLLHSQYYPLEKNSFKKLRNNVFENFSSLMMKDSFIRSNFHCKISMRKVKIYDCDKNLVSSYFELPRMYNKFKEIHSNLNEESLEFMRHKCGLISSVSRKLIKKKEVSEYLKIPFSLVLNQFKLQNLSYVLEVYEQRRFYKYIDMNKEKVRNFDCFINVNNEMHNEAINIISDVINSVRKVKLQVPIECHARPEIGMKYRNSIKLFSINSEKKTDLKNSSNLPIDVLDLDDPEKYKIIIMFSRDLSCLDEWRSFNQKIEKIYNEYSNTSIKFYFVFKNEEMDPVEELISNTFLSNNKEIKIVLAKGDSSNQIFLNSESYQYIMVILNKNNQCEYVGKSLDFDLVSSIDEMIKNSSFEKRNIITTDLVYDKFVKLRESFYNIQDIFKKLIKAGKCLYQPMLSFCSTKVEEYNNENVVNTYYKDIKINIGIKNPKLEEFNSVLESFHSAYNTFSGKPFLFTTYNTITIKIGKKCSECELSLGKIFYYCDKNEDYICVDCENKRNNNKQEDPNKTKSSQNNLILVKYEKSKILEEVIELYYNINKETHETLELDTKGGMIKIRCLLCSKDISSNRIIFLSLLHICNEQMYENKQELGINDDNINPVIFCEKCINTIIEKESRKILQLLKKSEINFLTSDFDIHNFILRKIIIN